jgi:plasmid replication initiation protein
MEIEKLKKREIIKMGNKLVESKFDLKTSEELKIFLIVLAQINADDDEFKTHKIHIKELEKLTGKKKNERQLKAIADKMLKKTIFMEDLNGWTGYSLFNKIRYIRKEAVLVINFHNELKPFLLNLKENFTKARLKNVLELESNYSIRMYLLLKQFLRIGKREFEIEKLKEILQVHEIKSYSDFFNIRNKILDKARDEINQKTDLIIDYKTEARAHTKKITHIIFTIKEKKQKKELEQKDHKQIIHNIRQIDTNNFNNFRSYILNLNKFIFLDQDKFEIKKNLLHKNGILLRTEEAKEEWQRLFKNKDKLIYRTSKEINQEREDEKRKEEEKKRILEEFIRNLKMDDFIGKKITIENKEWTIKNYKRVDKKTLPYPTYELEIESEGKQIFLTNRHFGNVQDTYLFLCKEYNLNF